MKTKSKGVNYLDNIEVLDGSVLEFTNRELQIVEWDVLNGYEAYYPVGDARADPVPEPMPSFQRYESLDPPIELRINTIVQDQNYSLVLAQPQRKEWETTVAALAYHADSDTFTGESERYRVVGRKGSRGNGSVEFTFEYQRVLGDSNSFLLIGHVRV